MSDEELLVYPPQTSIGGAATVAARLRSSLEQLSSVLGITVFPNNTLTVDGLVESASRSASDDSKVVNLDDYTRRKQLRALIS
jgi:hypothetical protein